MKLAASDYDGTLFRHNTVSKEDLEAIHLWRKAGHLFGLATGRDLNLSLSEMKAKKIEFDFLICNTGACVYIRDGIDDVKALQMRGLPRWAAKEILRHPVAKDSNYWVLCQGPITWLVKQREESWLTGLGLPLSPISWEEAEKLSDLQQISLEFNSQERAFAAMEELRATIGDSMAVHVSNVCVDLTAPGANKAEGIMTLLKITGWPVEEILVIGDTENDLAMIRRFGGYVVSSAKDEIKKAACGVYESPGQMLLDNL